MQANQSPHEAQVTKRKVPRAAGGPASGNGTGGMKMVADASARRAHDRPVQWRVHLGQDGPSQGARGEGYELPAIARGAG